MQGRIYVPNCCLRVYFVKSRQHEEKCKIDRIVIRLWDSQLDRGYLEEYSNQERREYEKLSQRILRGDFSFKENRYPPDERFTKLQKPVAFAEFEAANVENMWAQIPFCGSLLICLVAAPETYFEKIYFKKSDIDKMIDFTKETGKIQFVLSQDPLQYEAFDYLEPILTELKPPILQPVPAFVFGNEKDIKKAVDTFTALADIRFVDFVRRLAEPPSSCSVQVLLDKYLAIYCDLKLSGYELAEEIENLLVDDPVEASHMLVVCRKLISEPLHNMRFDVIDYTYDFLSSTQDFPVNNKPPRIQFPCEIGKFLLKKLTYAPIGMDACKEIMYHYDAYDLRKVQEALNSAIEANQPDVLNENVEELSAILDNVWNDKTLPNRVKGLQIGVPISMAAVGSVAAGPIGAVGGVLAGLGYTVVDRLIDLGTEGLSEKLAKLKTRSYQMNIYDFKKKYNK